MPEATGGTTGPAARAAAPAARRAVTGDAAALVRLRALMLEEMGVATGSDDAPWRRAAEKWFTERLDDTVALPTFAAFVVEEPHLGVVSCAAGVCDRHAPGPDNLNGLHGHVFNTSTAPRCRRRGYARACLEALLTWYRDETDVRTLTLNATPDGIGLYRSLGFADPRFPALRLAVDRGTREGPRRPYELP